MDSLLDAGKKLLAKESKKVLDEALDKLIDSNEIVDKLLEHASEALKAKFDPVPLPEVVGRFKKRIIIPHITGKASLSEGALSGVSDIKRLGEAELNIDPTSHEGSLQVGITFSSITLAYQEVRLRFGFLRQTVSVTAEFPALEITLKLDVREGRLDLQEFSLDFDGELHLVLDGLSGPMVWVANKIRRAVVDEVRSTSTDKIKEAAQDCLKLAAANVPVGI